MGTAADVDEYLKSHDGNATHPKQRFNLSQEACHYGNLEVLKACIKHGLSLQDCLHAAAWGGQDDMINFLLENGYASINEKDVKGYSVMEHARHYPETQKHLLELGAEGDLIVD